MISTDKITPIADNLKAPSISANNLEAVVTKI